MAAGVMSPLLSLTFATCFLQVFSQGDVFRRAPAAHGVLQRSKRANLFLLEELLQGNLERECLEELCTYEEAREYFEDTPKTIAFWTVYSDGDQCKPNPCLNGGNCTDKVGGFHCSCPPDHNEPICEAARDEGPSPPPLPAPHVVIRECPTGGPTACHQLCSAARGSFTCSCMSGFKLQSDGRSCLPEVAFPCGRSDKPSSTAFMCRHGNCPWQVSLMDSSGAELCGGVLLGQRSVLTAASCLPLGAGSETRPSDFHVLAGHKKVPVPVRVVHINNRFRNDDHENDLALLELDKPLTFDPYLIHLCLPAKDFSENVLMHPGRAGVVGNKTQNLVYLTLEQCRSQLNVSHRLTNKMFCMRKPGQASLDRHSAALLAELDGHVAVPNLNHTYGRPHGAQTQNSQASEAGGGLKSEAGGQSCGGLLPGTPVATVDRETAFLTGLLMSSPADCDGGGVVFAKVSRYLSWIRTRLAKAESHMTLQVIEYPAGY